MEHTASDGAISRRGLLGVAALGAGAALLPRAAWALDGAGVADGSAIFPHLAALAARYVDAGTLPGMVALINARGRPFAIARGVTSVGGSRAVDIDSLYRAYSMTKPITGMVAMQLIDEGKLGLDQPLADILPRYAKMQVQVVPDGSVTDLRPAKAPITMRHLLTHTAGLGYTIIQKGPIKDLYEANGLVPAQASHKPMPSIAALHPLPSLAAFADKLADMPLVYEPGTQWSYSVSLDLMGRVIEVVAGKPFDQVVAERIFGPCGMDSSGFMVRRGQAARLTSNYWVDDKGKLLPLDPAETSIYLDPPAYPFGGAGLVTSPRDYDAFLQMVLNFGMAGKTRVMSERAVRLGTADLLPGALAGGTDVFGRKSAYGAGGRVGLGDEAGVFGWGGAAGTIGFVNFRSAVSAGLWVQYMWSQAFPLGAEFPAALRADGEAHRSAKS